MLVLGEQLGAALAERHRLAAADLHLPHEEDPHGDQRQHRRPLDEEEHVPGLAILRLGGDLHALVTQQLDEVGILGGEGLEALAALIMTADVRTLDGYFRDLTLLDGGEELAEDDFGVACLLAVQQVEQQQHHQPEHQPERDVS